MNNINRHLPTNPSKPITSDAKNELNFDELVLQFIRINKPQGTASELSNQLKNLVPDQAPSLQQLSKALLYADTSLRDNPSYQDYTQTTLDKKSCQLLGVNMLINSMLIKGVLSSDEDGNDLF